MREQEFNYDVIIVGAGPAGLGCAIRLKQLDPSLTVCILEKGASVGSHILSGALIEPRALVELFPNWKTRGAPLTTPATKDRFLFLTSAHAFSLPTPPQMKNKGNYVASLGSLCRWLAKEAEEVGVEIYPSFPATECLFDENDKVIGVQTGPQGLDREGNPTDRFQEGVKIYGKMTLLAEGCRGSLTQQIIKKYKLDKDCDSQTYGIGLKEIWEIDAKESKPGLAIHTVGWPLSYDTYGGSFLYHMDNNQLLLGFVVGLDYENPYLNPFEEFQRFKTHPAIRPLLKGGKRLSYGARALNEGGYQSIPKVEFPGGSLIGCAAGFLNVAKIKGSHTALKSGMIAAEALYDHLRNDAPYAYQERLKKSWVYKELYKVRNIRPGFRKGLIFGLVNAVFETIMQGKSPWTLKNHKDYKRLKPAAECFKISYAKPDGVLTFDRLSSLYLSNISYKENQPNHLRLKKPQKAISVNFKIYDFPEGRYCPAQVYELVEGTHGAALQINAQNCIHCKACEIKDPTQNITWTPPEGASGPNYVDM
ncbi:MAG: electron transfer flavoprotein-ubiquinone oxidoreductase [Alphaproteobacteria bacterium]|nr:electron transfer flavoprotein-ubiquinone oxidoreductase [Alphaproteobacteria bacterium]